MVSYMVEAWIIYLLVGFVFLLLLSVLYCFYHFYNKGNKDKIVIIDKSNRWRMIAADVKNSTKFEYQNKVYFLKDDSCILNKKGKGLYIFSENNPNPLTLKYNSAEWMDSESLMASINNELIKLMVKPKDSFKDMLMIFGALGGILAGISSALILAQTFGLFGGG